ncbi:MAG: MFS transporter [Desulfobacteraceae bacterium]|nr:MFS transporter [Desulfobacteraceae bacterium]
MEETPSTTGTEFRDPHRWMVFAVCCLVYFFVYFHRVSTSVIAPDLLRDFDIGATALGFMSSMYFYLYAFEQPVVGYLADRLGPRRVIGYWSLAAAAGCLLFAAAPNIGWASAGRALIGLGVGGVYVPAIAAFSLWFRPGEFSSMLGLLMATGNFGAVIATTPLAWAASSWGWRPTFLLIGAITLLLAFVTLRCTRDAEPRVGTEKVVQEERGRKAPSGMRVFRILFSGQFWVIGIGFFGLYGIVLTLQGLWATPFLMTAFGIDRIRASQLNMMIPIGVIIGAPLLGWIADHFFLNKRNTLLAILFLYTLTWAALAYGFAVLGLFGTAADLLVMGATTGGFISLIWGIVRETTSQEEMGLKSGLLNPLPFLGVAFFQVVTGAILDRSAAAGESYPLSGYAQAFTVCLLVAAACLVLSVFIRSDRRLYGSGSD